MLETSRRPGRVERSLSQGRPILPDSVNKRLCSTMPHRKCPMSPANGPWLLATLVDCPTDYVSSWDAYPMSRHGPHPALRATLSPAEGEGASSGFLSPLPG